MSGFFLLVFGLAVVILAGAFAVAWAILGRDPFARATPPLPRRRAEADRHFTCAGCGSGPWHVSWDPDDAPLMVKPNGMPGRKLGPCCSGAD